jgi:hypothetical protein
METKIYNGIYTVVNKETGIHRTFRIRTQPENSKFAPGKRTVATLTSPDNNRGYTQFGFVTDDGINVWNKKRGVDVPSKWEWYAFMVCDLLLNDGTAMREKGKEYAVKVSKRCLLCNRRLTTPKSLKDGIGPECIKKLSPV